MKLAQFASRGDKTGPDQGERADAIRLRDRRLARDEAAERVADKRDARKLERIEQRDDVRRKVGNRIASGRPVGFAEAALVNGDRAWMAAAAGARG